MNYKIIDFKQVDESDGSLIYIESNADIPFEIKRVFYIFDTPDGVSRANHANKSTNFVLVCLHGSCKILVDNGCEQEDIQMSYANKGLYIPKMTWIKTYDFSKDCMLLVLASRAFEKDQYYENYDEFVWNKNRQEKIL